MIYRNKCFIDKFEMSIFADYFSSLSINDDFYRHLSILSINIDIIDNYSEIIDIEHKSQWSLLRGPELM